MSYQYKNLLITDHSQGYHSTVDINQFKMPQHVAIIMDGNGRWAKQRLMPRMIGHRAGVKSVRRAIQYCIKNNIAVLSLFAMSVENFLCRPESEVQFLISLLSDSLKRNLEELHQQNIRIRVAGNLSVFGAALQEKIHEAETLTQHNTRLTLVIALHYSGRWDILQAAQKLAQHAIDNNLNPCTLTEKDFSHYLCLHDLPEPDLMVRTSGEQRISNFMLWQFAYTELYFTDTLWPDFDEAVFTDAIATFQKRERRFGKICS